MPNLLQSFKVFKELELAKLNRPSKKVIGGDNKVRTTGVIIEKGTFFSDGFLREILFAPISVRRVIDFIVDNMTRGELMIYIRIRWKDFQQHSDTIKRPAEFYTALKWLVQHEYLEQASTHHGDRSLYLINIFKISKANPLTYWHRHGDELQRYYNQYGRHKGQ